MSCVVGLGAGQAFAGYHEVTHVFTIDDLVGGFDGRTYGTEGNYSDPTILCGIAGSPGCPAGVSTMTDKQGNTLYPIDSDFGFIVTDFAGAVPKTRPSNSDGDYLEGFAGTIFDGGVPVGISLANVATDTFRTLSGRGTWCAGLGNTSVKCSAEQYVVMEHVKSCYETIPYMVGDPERANPTTGAQAVLDYDGTAVLCDDYQLDNTLVTIGDVIDHEGEFAPPGTLLTPAGTTITSAKILYDGDPIDPGYLLPNESTVLDNIAESADYSVTAKDDGKPLYRWGDLHKRPNDIRMYARMALPAAWKDPAVMAANGGMGIRIESALLSVDHVVTNNPNDQLRPEDMENEGAIGRKPGYVDLSVGGIGLVSDRDCYEADSDFIPSGSVYQNANYPYGGLTQPPDPYTWSSDLRGAWSNGWYTTVDREPFEWSFDSNGDGAADYGNWDGVPADPADELISGPRWRLTAQKFGQTVPGLEIPVIECSEPPYQKDNIKYDVGSDFTTLINLLDWNTKDERSVIVPAGYIDAGAKVSPLEFSNGWLDEAANGGAVVNPDIVLDPGAPAGMQAISVNGAPITDDFDLSVYVKGDKKPTKVYDATLMVMYEDFVPPPDVSAVSLVAPAQALLNDPITVSFTVDNPHVTDVAGTTIEICGVGSVEGCLSSVETLTAASQSVFNKVFTAPGVETTITWTATVTAPGDTVLGNNQATDSTDVVNVPPVVDVVAVSYDAPDLAHKNVAYTIDFTVSNAGTVAAPISVSVCGLDNRGDTTCLTDSLASLDPAASHTFNLPWTAPNWSFGTVWWTATVTAAGDIDLTNNTLTGEVTAVRR